MDHYDTVVIGAGPGGLRTAEILARGGMRVLVLEKSRSVGVKVCAGGLTRKCKALGIPDRLVERSFRRVRLRTAHRVEEYEFDEPFLYTFDREALGRHQAMVAAEAGAELATGVRVTGISPDLVTVRGGERFGFRYLVGADGARSIVRRSLGIPDGRFLQCFQYDIPGELALPEIHFDHGRFGPWCLWAFPHPGRTRVGTGAFPATIPPAELKRGLDDWLARFGFQTEGLRPNSGVISCDYRGMVFRERFILIGDAAGLSFEFNGEGIYSALVSAAEAARTILEPGHRPDISTLLSRKRTHRWMLGLLDLDAGLSSRLHDWMIRAPRRPAWRQLLAEISF